MNLNKSKNVIFLNLLSLSGYFYLIAWLYTHFVVRASIFNRKEIAGVSLDTVSLGNSYFYFDILIFLLKLCFTITLVLTFLAIVEFFLRRKSGFLENEIFKNKIYNFFFWLGLLFQLSPICIMLITIFIH